MMGKVLVTGADGFIGSHLVEELVRQGRDVRAFVYYNSFGHRGWLDTVAPEVGGAIEVVAGDIRDAVSVREATKGCDTILHLAALIAIPYSYRAPDSYIDTNIRGTLNVVQAARDFSLSRVAITSTSEVYGTAQFVPITEEHPLVGQSPYAASKIGADQMALSYYRSFDTPVTVVRPFNTFGPRQSNRAVIPSIVTQIAAGERRIKLGALSPRRDLTYVRDTVRGMIAVLDCDAAIGEVVNLGTGFDISIGKLAEMIAAVMKVDVTIECEAERLRPAKSEVERLLSGTEKVGRLTGWKPEYAGAEGLRKALALTAKWFAQPENLARYHHDRYGI